MVLGLIRQAGDLDSQDESLKQIQKINDEYLYWDKIKHQRRSESFESPVALWQSVKLVRQANYRRVVFNSTVFNYVSTSGIENVLHYFDLHLGGSLSSPGPLQNEDRHRYLVSSLMEEAITSSQIEGAVTTRRQAKELLTKGRSPRNKSERMILNNYRTVERIRDLAKDDLTSERMLEIHRLVTEGTLDEPSQEGAFRQDDEVSVVDAIDGDVVYRPPAYPEVPGYVEALCQFFNHDDENRFIHPIVKACIIHFWVGWLHPFVDGNGRTARALFYWFLLRRGYWLVEYLSISSIILKSRTQYARAFLYTEYDDHDLTYFILYQTKVMRQALDSLKEYLERKAAQKQRNARLLRQVPGLNPRQAQVLTWLAEEINGYFTVRELQTRLGVSNQTARNDLDRLVAMNYLTKVAINAKEQHYVQGPRFNEVVR
jgi:Fic family protein